MPQEHRGVHLEAQALTTAVPGVAELLEQQSIDTEAGMLSGISQKHNMRSSPCRFTEFCNSQCLSHFAAPFIVDRTETSIAESCEQHIMDLISKKWQQNALKEAVAVGSAPASSACAPPTTHENLRMQTLTKQFTVVCIIMCE